ncbi:MAG: energy-coupling factor transporter transmembrane component T family protein [Acidimicrobiales bacterium]
MTTPVTPAPGVGRAWSRRERRRRRPSSLVLLRQVPGHSPIHRLWAGTKLLSVAALGLSVSFVPSWPAVAIVAGVLVGATLWAGVPRSALPRLPVWFWLSLAAGAVLTLLSGGHPEVGIGGAHVGIGNFVSYLRFTALSAVLLGCSALIGWTTALGDIAPAVARLGAPFRRLRLPVDEWAVTIALCVRSLPLLGEEMRTLAAARRLRPRERPRRIGMHLLDDLIDLLTAALAVSIRRAGELGEAITARGGSTLRRGSGARPGWRDLVAAGVVAGACGGVVAVGL